MARIQSTLDVIDRDSYDSYLKLISIRDNINRELLNHIKALFAGLSSQLFLMRNIYFLKKLSICDFDLQRLMFVQISDQ